MGKKKHELLFTRQEGLDGIDTAALLILSTGDEITPVEEAKARFVAACTEWLRDTKPGQAAWADSVQNFNIGDFLNHEARSNLEFQKLCEKYRVYVEHAEQVSFDACFSFDEVLTDDEWETEEEEHDTWIVWTSGEIEGFKCEADARDELNSMESRGLRGILCYSKEEADEVSTQIKNAS